MTVSTPEFELIFDKIEAKEARLDKLDLKIAKKEARMAAAFSNGDDKTVARLEGKVEVLEAKKATTAASIVNLEDLLPKDEISIEPTFYGDPVTGEVTYLSFKVTLQDSPYDDSLFPTGAEKGLAYSTTGRGIKANGGKGSWTRTVGSSDTVEEDAITTYTRGSTVMAEQWEMGESFTFSVFDSFGTKELNFTDRELLFTEQFDPSTYPAVITGPAPFL